MKYYIFANRIYRVLKGTFDVIEIFNGNNTWAISKSFADELALIQNGAKETTEKGAIQFYIENK